ncbi:MAG: VanZ family protein [Salinibacterium sp.]|nr:VanZ family protein [Salinibacterium sp.]
MRRALLTAALAAYAGFVLFVTLTPRMPGTGSIALLVNAALAELHARGLFAGVGYDTVEFAANIGMFVPLGVLTALVLPRRAWWVLLLAGTAFSGFIELYQSLLLPGRVGEWRDVLSNSLGFLVGAGVTWVAARSRR